MYRLINKAATAVVESIPSDELPTYEWLLRNMGDAASKHYRDKYRKYWAMGPARLGGEFDESYFTLLSSADARTRPLSNILAELNKSAGSLQFSFATKLRHMGNPSLPIYDSRVAQFYFFQMPKPEADWQTRVKGCVDFYDFLIREYARVLKEGLLTRAIQEFQRLLKPQGLTDEKTIDFLIWAFVTRVRKGAVIGSEIVYE